MEAMTLEKQKIIIIIPHVQSGQMWVEPFINLLVTYSTIQEYKTIFWSGREEESENIQTTFSPYYKYILAISNIASAVPYFEDEPDGYLFGVSNVLKRQNKLGSFPFYYYSLNSIQAIF